MSNGKFQSKTHSEDVHAGETQPAVTEKKVIKSLGQCAFFRNSDPAVVHVRDGRIVRIRPLHFEEKYSKDEIKPWKIKKNGKVLEPLLKSQLAPYQLVYKKRAYSPNRIKYPLKRVDWDPNGERNPQNRGKSKFKRISWDEATTIIASEIKRIQQTYGPYAVLCSGDGHGEGKTVTGGHGCHMLLMHKAGGFTQITRNPDSWEGWYWGAMHMWGTGFQGHMSPADNLLKDITDHTEMLVHIGCDLETTPWGFGPQFPSQVVYFWSSIGIKHVFVCPDLNYSAAVHADKWIPILPNTDAALHLAIAYIWITEGTYDKDYVATHVVGFDKFSDYVMGKEDGIPKTPEWASEKCGVPEWTIKALAREWASKTTSTIHYYGGSYIRGPYSHEPARLECCLLGMQGLGKPGVHQYNKMGDGLTQMDIPRPIIKMNVDFIRRRIWPGHRVLYLTPQLIPKCLLHRAIFNPPISTWGSGGIWVGVEDQFIKYTYPIPKEEGGTEVHMIWMDNPCRTTCWNNGYGSIEAFRSPKIECFVVQHPWLENDCVYADIILPITTKLEEEDLAVISVGGPLKGVAIEGRAIEPIGEAMSDYEAVGEVAKKLGLYEDYTEGMTIREKIKHSFESLGMSGATGLEKLQEKGYYIIAPTPGEKGKPSPKDDGVPGLISWEKLQEKGYYIIPPAPDWEKDPPGLRLFYEDPEKNPLETPSGKLEFYSQKLADSFPDDEERAPLPKWIERGVSHDERLSSERAKKYPLLIMSNHARWRTHAQNDDISWTREIMTCKVKGVDGYMYEPVWIHPSDAEKRGIQSGDIVKLYNERGVVLGGALVWERIMPGVVSMDHGARADIIATGLDEMIDRGGAINLITPEETTSKNCVGMASSGFLVEVEKLDMAQMEEWRKQYPEAFIKEYEPASGLRFNAWVEGGTRS